LKTYFATNNISKCLKIQVIKEKTIKKTMVNTILLMAPVFTDLIRLESNQPELVRSWTSMMALSTQSLNLNTIKNIWAEIERAPTIAQMVKSLNMCLKEQGRN
jgi:hypothetical protein